ncbi:MAG: DNA-directed RNA polymerase subunit RpoH/Rpb5 C-terminal domain-containing protein [Candidatus Micrarchaeaceae archaeon]|jgi:DNA-directed RNA polymerase subunit H
MPSKSDHELVPVHEIMSDKDVKELFRTFNITIDNLPKILESDIQAKKLEAKPGQVLKIYRREGKREYPYYRAVIDG